MLRIKIGKRYKEQGKGIMQLKEEEGKELKRGSRSKMRKQNTGGRKGTKKGREMVFGMGREIHLSHYRVVVASRIELPAARPGLPGSLAEIPTVAKRQEWLNEGPR
jgi:hypothetical protein